MNKKNILIIGVFLACIFKVCANNSDHLDQLLAAEKRSNSGASSNKAQTNIAKVEHVQIGSEYSVEKILTRYSMFSVPRDTNDRLQSAHEKKSFYAALALLEIMIQDGADIQNALNNLPEVAKQDLESLQKHAELLVKKYEDALWIVHRSTATDQQNNSDDLIRYIIQKRIEPAKKELQTLHSATSYNGLNEYFSLQYWRGLVGY